jgi:hypothetical protein
MRESCTYGSVRGATSNGGPYRNDTQCRERAASMRDLMSGFSTESPVTIVGDRAPNRTHPDTQAHCRSVSSIVRERILMRQDSLEPVHIAASCVPVSLSRAWVWRLRWRTLRSGWPQPQPSISLFSCFRPFACLRPLLGELNEQPAQPFRRPGC